LCSTIEYQKYFSYSVIFQKFSLTANPIAMATLPGKILNLLIAKTVGENDDSSNDGSPNVVSPTMV